MPPLDILLIASRNIVEAIKFAIVQKGLISVAYRRALQLRDACLRV